MSFVKFTRVLPEGHDVPVLVNTDSVQWVQTFSGRVTIMCENGPEVNVRESWETTLELLRIEM